MEEEEYYNHLASYLFEMLMNFRENLHKGNFKGELPKGTKERVRELKEAMEVFKQEFSKLEERSGINDEKLSEDLKIASPTLSKTEKRTLKRLGKLQAEFGAMKDMMGMVMDQKNVDQKRKDPSKPISEEGKPLPKRKKRKEGDIGFDQGWTRM